MIKVVITGSDGQLGYELQKNAPADVETIACTRRELDIVDAAQVNAVLDAERPDVIINAAAYTDVDRAETQVRQAFAVNESGAANIARSAYRLGARLVHISTDFVFDGKRSVPYRPEDAPAPLNVYGASKAAGEKAVTAACPAALILRTAWLYSVHGRNFVKTMLRLLSERERLAVVGDQVGTPSSAGQLASAIYAALRKPGLRGIYHWTDAGVASWYDFAVAIQYEACRLELLDKVIPISPISTVDYPMPAARPFYSVLDKTASWKDFGVVPVHWQQALRNTLRDLRAYSA